MAYKSSKEVINAAISIAEEYEKKIIAVPEEQRAETLSLYITEIREKLYWIKEELEKQ